MIRYEKLVLACLLGSAAASFVPSDTNLDTRETQVSDNGRLFCGIFGSGSKDNIENMQLDLQVGGLKDRMYKIGPGECNRVHCYETTGIYVCNVCVSHDLFSSSNLAPCLPPPFVLSGKETKRGSKKTNNVRHVGAGQQLGSAPQR